MDARELSCRVLSQVMDYGSMSGDELRRAFKHAPELDSRDRHFASRLVMGTLENILLLDFMLERFMKQPVKKCKPLLRELLRMGAFQIIFMDSVTDAAAVDESVKLSVKLGFRAQRGFVNAVLRNLCRHKELPEGDLKLSCSIPDYLYGLLKKQYGDRDAEGIARSFQMVDRMCVSFLTSRADVKTILESLKKDGAKLEKAPLAEKSWYIGNYSRIDELEAFKNGWIQVQGIGSALAGQLLSPKPGSRVLDICAAPGGKTILIADSMKDEGQVFACDIDRLRLSRINENLSRCGFSCVSTLEADASVFNPGWEETMDFVMADLPCSGIGTIGHKPEIRYRVTPSFLRDIAGLQRKILSHAWRYLKVGGTMVFSTCTLNKTENEVNFRWLLENFPVEPYTGEGFPDGLDGGEGFLQLYPEKHPCGFFVSRARRIR